MSRDYDTIQAITEMPGNYPVPSILGMIGTGHETQWTAGEISAVLLDGRWVSTDSIEFADYATFVQHDPGDYY